MRQTKTKIRATRKVRELLVELDDAFQKFGEQTRVLADRKTDASMAMEVGANREAIKALIIGIAGRINAASKER